MVQGLSITNQINVFNLNQSPDTLFLRLKKKDKTALIYLYDTYAPSLYGAILQQVGNQQLANEILQKTFITIWNECDIREYINQNVFTWMYSIANLIVKTEVAKAQHHKAIVEGVA